MKKLLRILGILILFGSLGLGTAGLYHWMKPSDEEKLYIEKTREAATKIKLAEAAKGTPEEAGLAGEAKAAQQSALVWGQGYRDRLRNNRLAVLASFGGIIVGGILLWWSSVKSV